MASKKKTLKKKSSKLQQIILGIGIMVLLVSFILYGLEVFYPEPKWEQFCEREKIVPPQKFDTFESCQEDNGKWSPRDYPCPTEDKCPDGYCDRYYYCQKEHNTASENHSMYVLLVLSILGVGVLIGGLFVKVPLISNSVMAGGVIIILRGIIGAWNFLSKYLQWALLGILLALLIWVSYKKFGNQ